MLIPIIPHNWQPFSHTGRATCGIGSTMSLSALPPIAEHDSVDFFSSHQSLLPFAVHGGYTLVLASIPEQASPSTLYPHKDAASDPPPRKADPPQCHPKWVPAVSHHVSELRLRLMTAGFHSRRPKGFAWSHFFPRSVGFGPTASNANGAFTIAPSILCQRQAIPSISSYSASPLRQRRTKTPFRFHSKKYLWMELELPNTSLGRAFHWHPVRRTYTIASKTLREAIGFRPTPGRRKYFFLFSRFCFGINDSTRCQSSSDTVHDFIPLMENVYHELFLRSIIIYG
jgi:hypothetical protein